MQDFRCYNETLKAIKIGLPGGPRDKQKTPRAHNPKAGPVFHKKSQQGQGKVNFFPAKCSFVVSISMLCTTCSLAGDIFDIY